MYPRNIYSSKPCYIGQDLNYYQLLNGDKQPTNGSKFWPHRITCQRIWCCQFISSDFPVSLSDYGIKAGRPGQARLHGCQVDTAVEREPKVSSNVRGKETLLGVEFGPRREVELLSQALWNQQKGGSSLITRKECLWSPLPKCCDPTQRERGWANPEDSLGTPSRKLGLPDQESSPRFVHIFPGYLTLHWKPEHFVFRVAIQSSCFAVAVVLHDKHKAYNKWNYMLGLFLKALTFMEN